MQATARYNYLPRCCSSRAIIPWLRSSSKEEHLNNPSKTAAAARLFHRSRPTSKVSSSKASGSVSVSGSTNPQAIADAFLAKFAAGAPKVRTQFLDANQLRLLSLTLDRPHLFPCSSNSSQTTTTTKSSPTTTLEVESPSPGTPLPPTYHLAYFTPTSLTHSSSPSLIAPDGSDSSFNPLAPFTRRMWAGGSVAWPGAPHGHLLRVGDTVSETTTVLSCDVKTVRRTGEAMLVVRVQKDFHDSRDNLCVRDLRDWVFREALDPTSPSAANTSSSSTSPQANPASRGLFTPLPRAQLQQRLLAHGPHIRPFVRSELELFRFSALTFNGHRIHYDKPWAVAVEGHRNIVVHGPLNLVAMVDFWRDRQAAATASADEEAVAAAAATSFPTKIEYRATSPLYAGEGYSVVMGEAVEVEEVGEVDGGKKRGGGGGGGGGGEKKTQMHVISDDGTLCMKGSITS